MLLCSSVVLSFINLSLKKYGDDHTIGAFGIISGIMGLAVMIVIGFNQGMQPIVGYNFGARQISRVLQAFKLTVLAATTITSISFLVAELFPWSIAKAFTNDDALINMTVSGLRLSFLMFPIVGFQIVTSNFFQSTGKSKISIFLSLIRQVLLLIPALIILPRFLGLNGVWLSLPASDFSSALLTYSLLQWQLKKLKAGEINM
jgi:Na+-driven multidrug efflux pump